MSVRVQSTGTRAIQAGLSRLSKGGIIIARAVVASGLSVLKSAAVAASPGTIKNEVGMYVRTSGNLAYGRAGLMQFPRVGDGPHGPHGVYLDQGTKHIQARHFIGRSMSAAMPRAVQAAKLAGYRTAQKIARNK